MRACAVAATGMLVVACSSGADRSAQDEPEVTQPSPSATDAPSTSATAGPSEGYVAAEPVAEPEPSTTSSAPTDTTVSAPASTEPAEADEPAWMSGESDDLFDQDELHTFEIELADDLLAELDADPAAEEYVEGALHFAGETIEPIGVRYKGSIGGFIGCTAGSNPFAPDGPKVCTKLSMQLKINWDDPSREFFGVRTVQLHSQNLDPTLMHERLGYWLFREMGVPAPRSTHARVIVNGEYLGVFALTEEVDGRFTRETFDDGTGNLYKEVWPFDGTGVPTTENALIAGLETNEDENPSAEIMTSFAAELVAAAPQERIDVIDRWSDVDLLLRAFVVDRAIKNDDGALHWYCFGPCRPHNFYWYEDPTARKVFFIPWDIDNAFDGLNATSVVAQFTVIADPFGEIRNDCQPFPFGSFNLNQRSAACDPLLGALGPLDAEFDLIRAEFLAGPFAEEEVEARLDEWAAQIEDAVAEAAAAHDDAPTVDAWRDAIELLKDGLAVSRAGNGR